MTTRRTDAILGFGLYGSERVLYARESREMPRLKAFCRVAPSVRLSERAIFRAGVL
jgi:hypothetical protein